MPSMDAETDNGSTQVRLATMNDLDAINDIYNHYVRTSTTTYQEVESSPQERLEWFTSREPRHVVTVAEIDAIS